MSPPKKKGTLTRVIALVRDYGAPAVGIYAVLWAAPLVVSFHVLAAGNNFGLDANVALAYLPVDATAWLLGTLGVAPGGALAPWHTSALLALLVADVTEVVRLPATLLLAPRAARWWATRRAGSARASGGGSSGTASSSSGGSTSRSSSGSVPTAVQPPTVGRE